MNAVIALLLALVSPQMFSVAQGSADSEVIRRLADSAPVLEPYWRYVGGVCSCPPLLDEQLGVSVASFERKRDRGGLELVEIEVYSVSSTEAASRWIRRFGDGSTPADWRIKPYRLGDEAFLATSPDGKSLGLTIRTGSLLIQVHGESLGSVERFARHVLTMSSGMQADRTTRRCADLQSVPRARPCITF